MQYRVRHTTTYDYTDLVSVCLNIAHLAPRGAPGQICNETSLTIQPPPAVVVDQTDYFGNPTRFFSVQEPHRQLTLCAEHLVDVSPRIFPDASQTEPWEMVRERLRVDRSGEVLDAFQFVCDSRYAPPIAAAADYARSSFTEGRPILDAVLDLTRRINADFEYDPHATTIATPLEQVFDQRCGVCQDFAHLEIACLRSLGLAARYVSGYLSTEPPPGHVPLVGGDATHAWLSVFCPGIGWVDVDPTNNQMPGDAYILLAWGRDYDDVSPVKGVVLGGGQHAVTVAVQVEPAA
ncbi:MAG TPA: transglutaminase family protein [Planctomycetaceae bacterium]|nr:transglutaminase family protein [Planctomycetaceae bacterium]